MLRVGAQKYAENSAFIPRVPTSVGTFRVHSARQCEALTRWPSILVQRLPLNSSRHSNLVQSTRRHGLAPERVYRFGMLPYRRGRFTATFHLKRCIPSCPAAAGRDRRGVAVLFLWHFPYLVRYRTDGRCYRLSFALRPESEGVFGLS